MHDKYRNCVVLSPFPAFVFAYFTFVVTTQSPSHQPQGMFWKAFLKVHGWLRIYRRYISPQKLWYNLWMF